MCNSFCTNLQSAESEQEICGLKPLNPIGNFPEKYMSYMTCVYQLNGFTERYIFVGQSHGYNNPLTNSNADALGGNKIGMILNVAYDVNDPASFEIEASKLPSFLPSDGPYKYYLTQLAKVGLIDGPEDDMMTVLGALYMADQLLNFPTPEQQFNDGMVNIFGPGNLLIHCYDGGSRSVTVAALYIYYKYYTNTIVTFEDIYKKIICYRWNHAANHHPSLGMCQTAFKIVDTFSEIFPKPIYKVKG